MRRLAAILIRSFLQGLLILSPIALTAYVIFVVFDGVDRLIPGVPRGLGFLSIITVVTFIGYLGTRFFVGRMLVDSFDYILEHIPGIRFIYSSIKEVMDSFVGDKKRFNKPVWVCTNHNPEIWRIGFMTQKDLAYLGMNGKVAVYLPHSYAISGYVIIVDEKNVKPVTKMNAAEAMKFAVSGGITASDEEKNHLHNERRQRH
ncbi:MAG TPA: DUF502 domain-containing protein [Flavipsychrobacter sp.]|nr:DUF502 domain-containing protein [Flavipsychrobacter sp.]